MKSQAIVFLLFLLTVFGYSSCQKKEQIPEAYIALISPSENSLIYLPDTIQIRFKIESEAEIESVDISVVNSSYISLFGTKSIHRPQTGVEIETTLLLNLLQNSNNAPYYIRFIVRFPNSNKNSYFDIQLATKQQSYKGFFLFFRPGINQTQIDFYDQNFEDSVYFSCSGEYVGSEISSFYKSLYLLTKIPAVLSSYDIENQQVNWKKNPEFPMPEFTCLQINEDRIYAGMKSGQIVGYAQLTGQQKLITEVLVDSFPEKIHVMNDYVVGDYLSRLNGARTIVTFYKETGVKKHRHPVDFNLVSFIKTENPEKVMVIGNENNKGVISLYDVQKNFFEGIQQIEEGLVNDVCELHEGVLLLLIENSIYQHNYQQNITSELVLFQELPDKIYYEQLSKQLVVQFDRKLLFFSYPEIEEIAALEFNKSRKAVQFYYPFD